MIGTTNLHEEQLTVRTDVLAGQGRQFLLERLGVEVRIDEKYVFAAWEQPKLFSEEVRAGFRSQLHRRIGLSAVGAFEVSVLDEHGPWPSATPMRGRCRSRGLQAGPGDGSWKSLPAEQ